MKDILVKIRQSNMVSFYLKECTFNVLLPLGGGCLLDATPFQ